MENRATLTGPVNQTERIDVLDALRGFAVFGMFIINIRVFSGYSYISEEIRNNLLLAGWNTTFDRIHYVFFNAKFYTLFALLFGIGFAIQLTRGSSAGNSFILRYSRRLFFLLLIGLVHLWGIWFSDILVLYAICGYILILFRGFSNRSLIWTVAFLLIIPGAHSFYLWDASGGYANTLYQWISERWIDLDLPRASEQYHTFQMADIAQVIREGSPGEVMKFNSLGPLLRLYVITYDARLIKILAIFILGFWVGRKILYENIHKSRPFLIRTAVIAWLIGLPMNIIFVMDNKTGMDESSYVFIRNVLDTVGYISLTSAYAATFALLYLTGFRTVLDRIFNRVGKTALSNYILQSLLSIVLFYSAGFGLGQYPGSALLTLAVIIIFLFQVQISAMWLKYFRYGPLEWLWRTLTYGKYIPNRR